MGKRRKGEPGRTKEAEYRDQPRQKKIGSARLTPSFELWSQL